MASMRLSYNKTNRCFVKLLEHWIAKDGGKRVPRYFLFPGDRGMGEQAAAKYSICLFKRVWRKFFARCRQEGHMLRQADSL